MQDTCFEENVPHPLFQWSNFLQNMSHSETLTQGDTSASLWLKKNVNNYSENQPVVTLSNK